MSSSVVCVPEYDLFSLVAVYVTIFSHFLVYVLLVVIVHIVVDCTNQL